MCAIVSGTTDLIGEGSIANWRAADIRACGLLPFASLAVVVMCGFIGSKELTTATIGVHTRNLFCYFLWERRRRLPSLGHLVLVVNLKILVLSFSPSTASSPGLSPWSS